MKDEQRNAFCYQRATEDMMRQLRSYTIVIQNTAKLIAMELLKSWTEEGLITEEQAEKIALDLKV